MPRCSATKRNGERCRVSVERGVELCWAHDLRNASQRKRITSKAGKSKPSRELIGIKERLSSLAEDVLRGNVDKGDAAVASQLYNVLLRAIGGTKGQGTGGAGGEATGDGEGSGEAGRGGILWLCGIGLGAWRKRCGASCRISSFW